MGPSFYRRYVDDIFAVFENKEDSFSFLEYLNTKHENIKFTKEFNVDGKLPFLDVLVENKNTLRTSVYHKPTFTGLLTNFRSFVPLSYKIRLIKTLIDRIYKINNTWKGFHENVEQCAEYLSRNLFPRNVIDRNIKEYLDKKMENGEIGKKRPIMKIFNILNHHLLVTFQRPIKGRSQIYTNGSVKRAMNFD